MPNTIDSGFQRWDYVKITLFGFAITALWQSLHTIILPLRLLDFVPETQKNTYLGLLTLSGLFLAMLVQPIAGALSDCSGSKWGQRRPFILIGGAAAICILPGVGFAGGFAAIFLVYCLMQIATNTAQGPFQAFIPDLVPYHKHGMASGFKALFEIVGGVILVYVSGILMDRYSAGEDSYWLWIILGILGVVLVLALIYTLFSVREIPGIPVGKRSSVFSNLWFSVREVLANRNMVWFLVSRLLVYMAFATIQQFALYYLRDVIGVTDPAEATARFTIFAVVGMLLVVWPAGYVSDKIGRKPVIMISGLLGAGGIAIIALTQEYTTILWAAAVIGVAMGAFNSTNWAMATDLVEKGEEARYLGIVNIATAGGAALARAIGPAIDYINLQSENLGYNFLLIVCLAYFAAGATLILKVKTNGSMKPE